MLKKFLCSTVLFISFTSLVNATIVEFQTSQGKIQVNLFDQTTPKTVENFLQYIDEQHYTNSVVHRVVPGFIIQGGGFSFDGDFPLTRKEANPSVINEPIYSNVTGTISMAKLGDQPNSATDQWFFNLKDNNTGTGNDGNLDLQNGGFTAFGQVIGDGMETLAKIENLILCAADNHTSIPIAVDEGQECADAVPVGIENFVVIESITIIDSSEATDADLNPVQNTQITTPDEPAPTPDTPTSNSGGGGSFSWLSIFCLLLISIRRLSIQK